MGFAVTVVDFMLSFEGDADFLKYGFASVLQGVEMFLFEPFCESAQRILPVFQQDLVGLRQGANVGQA